MFALQNLVRNAPKIVNTTVQNRRHGIITKPRQRISLAEKLAHGLVIAIVPLIIPTYVAAHILKYREEK